jgi:F0F1-type ATP synthase assembly protein I
MLPKKEEKSKEKKAPNSFLRFTSIATQMAIIIACGVFGGIEVDNYLSNQTPIFTLLFSLLGVGVSMYMVIKDLSK